MPSIQWIGIKIEDIEAYQLSNSCKIPLSKQDEIKAKKLLKKLWIMENKCWRLVNYQEDR